MPDGTQVQQTDQEVADLLREMREKAEIERDRLLEAARAEAQTIEERSRRECTQLEQEGLQELRGELSVERDRTIGEVVVEAREERLALKRSAMDSVFEAAEREIEQRIGGEGWDRALDQLLREAVEFVGPGSTIVVSNEDLAPCKKLLTSIDPASSLEGDTVPRGRILAASADGRRHAENSLGARLKRVKGSRSGEIARILFGMH